ncbi:MAG: phosphatidate cytidylyltransferase [Bacteroidales bacterium]|nr:phosphatidate cytidylyltransferase [Bacteroidales bacterium]
MSELLKRSITGFILVAVMIAAIALHSFSAMGLFVFITFFTLREFYSLTRSFSPNNSKLVSAIMGVYIVMASFLSALQFFSKWLLLPYFLYLIYLFISELYNKKSASILSIAVSLFGHFYIAIPFALIGWFGFFYSYTYQPILILALFFTIWVNDSGAYLVGSQIGKHRLFERISPKKSWEGFFGGLIIAVAFSQLIAHYFPIISPLKWVGFSIITSISATYGDLFESFLKRSIGVKDSGTILPGHGGMLDRFDAPLFAIPTVMIYLYFFC